MYSQKVVIQNDAGFHIRPAQLFTEKAIQFQSTIMIMPEGTTIEANAKSILNLMTLGLEKGSVITIQAEGPDETEAVAELSELVKSGFGET
ncbi:PTS sugar transporter [Paenibacillus baekrokdamisoli]|uniref:Phosphocarrier protein HPr n=1 Tax=Paenibacillus baekrokdamisoli TaxID=1712516 RepID=A0A3G9IZ28_9BACL|nr:HPr family phosphocarrier protein [Paenibacillus baekrokdamisoli]MBB3071858.1 phosphocarrier protein HPr/phosphocarrier protein [Paenibacillus baekrokdamisoli]BBH24160.1 PTS sugar transporter [Paenibacillus baekrokdamisoli]